MPQSFAYAFTHAWWTWEQPAIRAALRQAFLAHWVPVVEQAFMRNRRQGGGPTEWPELVGWQLIRQDPRNIEKKAEGRYGCSDGFMLGLSTALGLPLCQLYPTTEEYLQKATLALLKGRAAKDAVTEYVRFRLATTASALVSAEPGQNGHVRPPPERSGAMATLAAVQEVAAALEPILATIDQELCDRSSSHESNHERRTGQPRSEARDAAARR